MSTLKHLHVLSFNRHTTINQSLSVQKAQLHGKLQEILGQAFAFIHDFQKKALFNQLMSMKQ